LNQLFVVYIPELSLLISATPTLDIVLYGLRIGV